LCSAIRICHEEKTRTPRPRQANDNRPPG
jgi:hypothetical protein